MKKYFLLLIFVLPFIAGSAQDVPLDIFTQNRLNELAISADTSIFTSFRSINWLELKPYLKNRGTDITDSIFGISNPGKSYAFKKLMSDNWIMASGNKHVFTLDPIFNLAAGTGNNNNSILYASGGIRLQGILNDKFSYSAAFVTGYQKYPNYINDYIDSNQNYQPGLGKGSLIANGDAYTSSQFTGNITYNGGKHFLASAGYGKNFIGDGYRSLILSDNPSNNPYIRVQARVWKLTYNVLYNKYENPRIPEDGHPGKKVSVMHYLGINFSSRFQMALYDNVTFMTKDSFGHRGFDVLYLNPLIFIRPLEFAVGSPDNAFVGITFKYKFYKNGFVYGQLGLDDLNLKSSLDHDAQHFGNKYGLQLGIWNKDLFHVQNLSYRLEWNGVRPYMYGHGFGKTGLNYTHNNQVLTDPFNANYNEFISIFQYHKERWYGLLENLFTIRGENPGLPYNNGENPWGGEAGVPIYGSKTMQGNKNKYFYNQLTAGYLLNPRNKLGIETNIVYRKHTSPTVTTSDFFFSLGIKTRLFNNYHDF